jgi:hypothetical protein
MLAQEVNEEAGVVAGLRTHLLNQDVAIVLPGMDISAFCRL